MAWFGDATSGASNAMELADMCETSCCFQMFLSMRDNDFSAKRSFYRAHIRRLHRKIRCSERIPALMGAEADINGPMAPAQSVENEPEPTTRGPSGCA
jgi:hypothetical protein